MLTKDEALRVADAAERYPPGVDYGAWGHSGRRSLGDMMTAEDQCEYG